MSEKKRKVTNKSGRRYLQQVQKSKDKSSSYTESFYKSI